jgi:hypothetical protein
MNPVFLRAPTKLGRCAHSVTSTFGYVITMRHTVPNSLPQRVPQPLFCTFPSFYKVAQTSLSLTIGLAGING